MSKQTHHIQKHVDYMKSPAPVMSISTRYQVNNHLMLQQTLIVHKYSYFTRHLFSDNKVGTGDSAVSSGMQ